MEAVSTFSKDHIPQITATIGLVTFALAKNKLTPAGILAAILTALIHMSHPQIVYFWLLVSFFLIGVVVTKVGHAHKAHLTQSSTGSTGGEGARNWIQVLSNSAFASVLILVDLRLAQSTPFISSILPTSPGPYVPGLREALQVGIFAQYAAVTADTCSSELGILAKGQPFMIIPPWKKVAKGTNGGVTLEGLFAGFAGSVVIVCVGLFIQFGWSPFTGKIENDLTPVLLMLSGLLGSVLDSLLGAVCQETVTDKRTGKVIEGSSGAKVQVMEGGSRLKTGRDLLSNNGVNFVMAALTSIIAMIASITLDMRL